MGLHLIIDGYNLIRQSPALSRIDARDLEAGREALLARLAAYRLIKPLAMTVVFDGWSGGGLRETRDRSQGIAIIYSRRGERADEVIKRLLAQDRSRAVAVSSDREIQEFAERVGAEFIGAPAFEARLNQAAAGAPPEDPENLHPPGTRKKGPSHRPPKRQRQRASRLKKI